MIGKHEEDKAGIIITLILFLLAILIFSGTMLLVN